MYYALAGSLFMSLTEFITYTSYVHSKTEGPYYERVIFAHVASWVPISSAVVWYLVSGSDSSWFALEKSVAIGYTFTVLW